jgi:hypothetical protein
LDEATEGAIYFSLGSLIVGGLLPEDKFQDFIAVFSELPQRILWKIDRNVSLPNVRTSWWLPQFEILSEFFCLLAPGTFVSETPAPAFRDIFTFISFYFFESRFYKMEKIRFSGTCQSFFSKGRKEKV